MTLDRPSAAGSIRSILVAAPAGGAALSHSLAAALLPGLSFLKQPHLLDRSRCALNCSARDRREPLCSGHRGSTSGLGDRALVVVRSFAGRRMTAFAPSATRSWTSLQRRSTPEWKGCEPMPWAPGEIPLLPPDWKTRSELERWCAGRIPTAVRRRTVPEVRKSRGRQPAAVYPQTALVPVRKYCVKGAWTAPEHAKRP